jgi:hypothetical protein
VAKTTINLLLQQTTALQPLKKMVTAASQLELRLAVD